MRRPPPLHAFDVPYPFEVVFVLRLAPPALLAFAFAGAAALRLYAEPLASPITHIGQVKLATLQTLALATGMHPHPPQPRHPVQPSPHNHAGTARISTQPKEEILSGNQRRKTERKSPRHQHFPVRRF
jgi:hypothetical protein